MRRSIAAFIGTLASATLPACLVGCHSPGPTSRPTTQTRAAAPPSTTLPPSPRYAPANGTLVIHERNDDFAPGGFQHASPACCGNQGVFLLGADANPGVYESPVIAAAQPFDEALISWNIAYPPGAGGFVEFRVGRAVDGFWSPWLYVGDWGNHTTPDDRVMVFDGGEIEVDYFRSPEHYDRAQYRVTGLAPHGLHPPTLRRMSVCMTDEAARPSRPVSAVHATAPVAIPVPFRTQKTSDSALAGRLCSPASLAMVLEYRGVHDTTEAVARLCWDPTNDIYGGWPRNVQAAFELGVPGYLTRFTNFAEAQRCLAAGQPIVASIRVERPGELRGAPYRVSDGHLLVITGFDDAGDVLVNDPAGNSADNGQLTYARDDMRHCWLENGGVAYILLPAERRASTAPPASTISR